MLGGDIPFRSESNDVSPSAMAVNLQCFISAIRQQMVQHGCLVGRAAYIKPCNDSGDLDLAHITCRLREHRDIERYVPPDIPPPHQE